MSDNYKDFAVIEAEKIGEISVVGWRILGGIVNVSVEGVVNFGFDVSPDVASALAAQLIAAADYAEGKE